RSTPQRVMQARTSSAILRLSLHDALPIYVFAINHAAIIWRIGPGKYVEQGSLSRSVLSHKTNFLPFIDPEGKVFKQLELPKGFRSEEHTSELQSRENLVCRLLLEKKKACR